MTQIKIEINEVCRDCGGTGLLKAKKKDGAAVVCSKCDGSGCYSYTHRYDRFESRFERDDIEWVYQVDPSEVTEDLECEFSNLGGMSYKDWKAGREFERGMEMRKYFCPFRWCQVVDYYKRPDWDACYVRGFGKFSQCLHFKDKEKCWERWDRESR